VLTLPDLQEAVKWCRNWGHHHILNSNPLVFDINNVRWDKNAGVLTIKTIRPKGWEFRVNNVREIDAYFNGTRIPPD